MSQLCVGSRSCSGPNGIGNRFSSDGNLSWGGRVLAQGFVWAEWYISFRRLTLHQWRLILCVGFSSFGGLLV